MAILLTPPYLQFFDDDGNPLAGGKVYTYSAGTTTPKATYTTQAGTVQNANPVVLDSSGRCVLWGNGSYRIDVKTSSDVLIKTVDNVTAFVAENVGEDAFYQSFSGDGTTTAFTLSESLGTGERNIQIFIDSGLRQHVTNGTFASDTGWTKGTGWTIGSGVATATGAISTALEQTSAVTLVQGQAYIVTFTATRSAGGIIPSIGGTSGTERTSSGTYTELIIAGSTQTIAFTGNGFTGTIDTVTVTPAVSAGFQIQNPSSYTLSNTTLTFTSAPATGSNNIRVYSPATRSLVGGATDAINVAYSPSGTGAVDTTVQAKLREFVSVKDFGAVGDGSTDDAAAINAALVAYGRAYIPNGTFLINSPIFIRSDMSLEIGSGATLKAGASFTGDAMIVVKNVTASTFTENFNIFGRGAIDGNSVANKGIFVYYGRRGRIDNLFITLVLEKPIHIGDAAAPGASSQIELFNNEIWFNELDSGTPPVNTPTSIGVHYDNCSDSYCEMTKVVGYRTGFRTDGGDIDFSKCHAWTRGTYMGPMVTGFSINAGNNRLFQCYADTPTNIGKPPAEGSITDCYGFFINAFGTQMQGCRVYMNATYAVDNLVTAFYFNIGDSQSIVYGASMSTADITKDFKKYFGGTLTKVSRIGVIDDGNTDFGVQPNVFYADRAYEFEVATSGTALRVNGPAGTARALSFGTAGVDRFLLRVNTTAESGSDVGSNFEISGRKDDGTFLNTPLSINRSTGQVALGDSSATSTTNVRLNTKVQTTVGAAGGASALPATPTGYLIVNVAGTDRAIPYYAVS